MRPDRESELWVEELRPGHPRRDRAVATLHETLVRVAVHEQSRRRDQLGLILGPESGELARRAADDALTKILARLDDYQGLSRFTTWAYKFVIFEISGRAARARD